MYFTKVPYLKFLLLLFLTGHSLYVSSQKVVADTNEYIPLLRGTEVQSNLNYALLTAASQGNSIGIEWLLKYGADVNTTTVQNVTPVLLAVSEGEKEALKVLLAYDPDLDRLSVFDESALMVAVKNQNLEIAEMLLRDSANVNLQERHGYTALHFAAIYGSLKMTDLLLYYDADVNIRSKDGITPLMVAAYGGYADITDLLLQNRARVTDKDEEGFTALMLAAQNGDTLVMDLLLGRGADINEVNKYNYNALDIAVRLNYPDAVKYILEKSKNRPAPEIKAVNPYEVATIYRRNDIPAILRQYNIPEPQSKGIDQISLSGSVRASFHDIYTGFSITARDPGHNLGFFAGFDLKPGWTRVIVKESDIQYYQYMDKSYLFYAGILKEKILTDDAYRGDWFVCGSLAAGYSFGNEFKGTSIKPESRLRLIPAAGLRYSKNAFGFQFGIEYTNTEFHKIGPLWLRVGFSYTIDLKNLRGPVKVIKW